MINEENILFVQFEHEATICHLDNCDFCIKQVILFIVNLECKIQMPNIGDSRETIKHRLL